MTDASGATTLIRGDILVAADTSAPERAEALAIVGDRVTAVGRWDDVRAWGGGSSKVVDARDSAVIPGLHDFHLHLVGLARTRLGATLDDAVDAREVADRIDAAVAGLDPEAWVHGRGWTAAQLDTADLALLDAAAGGRPAFMPSHDGHSAWASTAALRLAGVDAGTPDPPGGRIERTPDGAPTGVLRESAMDLVASLEPRAQGAALRPALDATLAELSAFGITGASEAGDYTAENGTGAFDDLGDSASTLLDLADLLDGRLRMSIGIPAAAIDAAAARGLRTAASFEGRATLRFGWAKSYADGALGSGTAALFEPRTCGDPRDTGILRLTPDELDDRFRRSRAARIGMAIHAIGDRAAAAVLDALERAPLRQPGVPDDRMEHVQLLRAVDRRRLAAGGMTASIQPIHAAADRDLVDACWDGRQADAYAWRSLRAAGARLAAGSDAPVESVNPWSGLHAAMHRRFGIDRRADWRPDEALTVLEALEAYTLGPARAIGAADEGHLRVGARADLAVLPVGLDALLSGQVEFDALRSTLTMVNGRPVGPPAHERPMARMLGSRAAWRRDHGRG